MKYNQPLQDVPVSLWRRITAFINIVLLTFYACLPGTAAAYEFISDAFIETEINSNPQFQISSNNDYLVEKAYYVTDTTSISTQTIASFHQKLLDHRKSSLPVPLMIPIINGDITIIIPHYPLEKLIGDSFVQSRFIRSQIFNQLNRNLLNDTIGTEAQQINTLYNQAFEFSALSNKRFGEQLTRSDINTFGKNLIWPELRNVNGQTILVPVVHLTDITIDAQLVDGHVVEFGGAETQFNNITINAGTLNLRRNTLLNVASNLNLNEGAKLKSSHDLNVLVGGTLQNISGQISAEGNAYIIAGQYLQKTMVHRYATKTTQGSRLGQIASVDANGNIYIKTSGDLVVKGGTISGSNIILKADGNIVLQSQETTYVRNEEVFGWNESESIIQQLGSQLTAEENIRLIASGAIEINASTLHADKGAIEILAGQGVYILNAENQFQSQRNGKFGSTTIQEQEFQTIAMRSAIEAGKGIVIATELGDVTLKGTQLTSASGTEIIARNGSVNFLLTKEQSNYFYNKVVKGFWKIKTTTQQDDVETAVYNEIVGGIKVQATHGMTLELGQYEDGDIANGINTETSRISAQIKALTEQINALTKIGASVSSLEAQRDLLSQDLLNEQLAQLAQTDSLAWMQTLHNDPEYTDNFNLVYQELVELHKFDKTSNLSPAAMAIIAIAVAVAMGPAGAGLLGTSATAIQGAGFISAAAMQAGALAIATQAATGLASGQGLENTAKSLFHSDNIRATATAMVTAGALDYFKDSATFFDNIPTDQDFSSLTDLEKLQTLAYQTEIAVRNAVVRTGISTVISGGDLGDFNDMFVQNLAQSVVDKIGEAVAGEIGDFTDLDPALRYIAHAGLGCLTGSLSSEISGSDTELGCYSGAGGAVIGEVTADLYLETLEDDNNAILTELAANGDAYTQQELRGLATELKQKGVDIAKLSAAFAALVLGGNVDIAATAGQNAAENNSLSTLILHLMYEWNQPGYHKAQLALIGRGEHPSQALIDEVIAAGVDLVVDNTDPQTLKDIASQIDTVESYSQEYVGQYVDDIITFVYLSDTGQAITAEWNSIPGETRDALIGAGKVLSILIPIAKVKYIGDVNNAIKIDHQKSVDTYYDNEGNIVDPNTGTIKLPDNVTVIKGFDSVTDSALNPELLRSDMDGYVKDTKVRDGYSLSAASITVDGKTIYLTAVSGALTVDVPFRGLSEINLNGVTYILIHKDSESVMGVYNPENGQNNINHAEKKLMSYMQDNYSGQSANVTITSQNTFADKPGMCTSCTFSNVGFGTNNPSFTINMFHGVTND